MMEIELNEVRRQIVEEAKNFHKEMTPEIEAECCKIAENRVRLGFIVAEISRQQKISVTRSEIANTIRNIAMMYPGEEQAIWNLYSRNEAVNAIAGPILESKVIDYLFGIINIKDEVLPVSELIAIDEETFDFFKDGSDVKKEIALEDVLKEEKADGGNKVSSPSAAEGEEAAQPESGNKGKAKIEKKTKEVGENSKKKPAASSKPRKSADGAEASSKSKKKEPSS
jgi:trigger factor